MIRIVSMIAAQMLLLCLLGCPSTTPSTVGPPPGTGNPDQTNTGQTGQQKPKQVLPPVVSGGNNDNTGGSTGNPTTQPTFPATSPGGQGAPGLEKPRLIPPGSFTTDAEQPFAVQLQVNNQDKTGIQFYLGTELAGAAVDPATGVFSWTPTNQYKGSKKIRVLARRGDLEDSTIFEIIVKEVIHNVAPVFLPFTDKITIMVLERYNSVDPSTDKTIIHALDEDGDDIIYSAEGVPTWATFNAQTQIFEGVPPYEDEGKTFTVTFIAMNPQDQINLISRKSVTINVVENPFLQESYQAKRIIAPGILKRAGDWDSEVVVQNTSEVSNPITINFYCNSKVLAQTLNQVLNPFASFSLHNRWMTTLNNSVCDPSGDAAEFSGSVEIVGEEKLSGVVNLHRVIEGFEGTDTDEGTSYPIVGPLGKKIFFPNLYNNPDQVAAGYTNFYSRFGIINSGSEPTKVSLDFINKDTGTSYTTTPISVTINPFQKISQNIQLMKEKKNTGGEFTYPFLQGNFRFSLVATATGSSIAGYVNTTSEGGPAGVLPSSFRSFGTIAQGGFQTRLFFPLLYNRYQVGSAFYSSELAVQNAGDKPIKIKIRYQAKDGGEQTVTSPTLIPQKATWVISANAAAANDPDIAYRPTAGFFGGAVVESVKDDGTASDQPIVGIIHTTTLATDATKRVGYGFNGLGPNKNNLFAAAVYKASGGQYPFTSCLCLMNTEATPATVNIEFYSNTKAVDVAGADIAQIAGYTAGQQVQVAAKPNISIAPLQTFIHCLDGDANMPAGFLGSARIQADRPIVGLVINTSPAQNREMAYTFNGY